VTIVSGFGKMQWLRLRKKQDTSLWRDNGWEKALLGLSHRRFVLGLRWKHQGFEWVFEGSRTLN
jgi:hypothetical protein